MPAKNQSGYKRHLKVEGTFNLRDIGGYETSDGHRTRWGTYLRSDALCELPSMSQQTLIDYGIRTVIDLRTPEETEHSPNSFANSSDIKYHHRNAYGDNPLPRITNPPKSEDGTQNLFNIYAAMLDHKQPEVFKILSTLADPDTMPVVVHCASGQDRAGRITALVLGIARVPKETIAYDYALSSKFLVHRLYKQNPEMKTNGYTWQDYQRDHCPPRVMLKLLQHLDKNYGGVEGYARNTGLNETQISNIRKSIVE